MKNKTALIIWIVLFAVLIAAAFFGYRALSAAMEKDPSAENAPAESAEPTESPAKEADDAERPMVPDFTLLDRNGSEVSFRSMTGKPMVLNFWATWCPPCKMELPDFNEAYAEYGDEVVFMMINLTTHDNLGDAQDLISRNGYTFPVYFDKDNSTAASYSTGSIPMSFFINSKGELVTYAVGAIDEVTLEKAIGMIQ